MPRALLVLVLTLGVPAIAAAQSGGTPDFLFGRPRASVGLRGSRVFARAGSDFFRFVEQNLTVERNDFDAPAFAADLGIRVTERIDAVFGVDVSQTSIASEYRHLVDNNRQPITQSTRLREVNLGGSVRVALTPRGRGISRFAWIPARATPYAGGGGGALFYELTQSGDFVDALAPPPQPIFSDVFQSSGWTPSAHAFTGVDIRFWRRWYMTVDGRYLWAAARLGRDFQGFDPIDLAGFRLSAGVNVLF